MASQLGTAFPKSGRGNALLHSLERLQRQARAGGRGNRRALLGLLKETPMPRKERIREAVTSLANPNYLTDRAAAGWRMSAIEWERDIPDEAPEAPAWSEDIPYGMQVSADGARLIENSAETEAVVLALDMIVEDCPLSQVSSEMNRRGYRMRDGKVWTPTALFSLLPRMIQMGPRLFSSEQWMSRRQKLPRVV